MKKLHELDEQERERVRNALAEELQREREVVFAYLYGSFVTPLPFEDVDVAVYLQSPDGATKILDLAVRLSLSVRLPVDVRALNDAPASFRYGAMKGILLVNRDEDLWAAIVEDTVRRYFDMEPFLRHSTVEAFSE